MLAYLKRGETYRRRGETGEALRDLRRAAELDPTATKPLELLGDLNASLERYARAQESYEAYLRLDDRSPRVLYKLALARYRLGQRPEGPSPASAGPLGGRPVRAGPLPARALPEGPRPARPRPSPRSSEPCRSNPDSGPHARHSPNSTRRPTATRRRSTSSRRWPPWNLAGPSGSWPWPRLRQGRAVGPRGDHLAAASPKTTPRTRRSTSRSAGSGSRPRKSQRDRVALNKALEALDTVARRSPAGSEALLLLGRAQVLAGDLGGGRAHAEAGHGPASRRAGGAAATRARSPSGPATWGPRATP